MAEWVDASKIHPDGLNQNGGYGVWQRNLYGWHSQAEQNSLKNWREYFRWGTYVGLESLLMVVTNNKSDRRNGSRTNSLLNKSGGYWGNDQMPVNQSV